MTTATFIPSDAETTIAQIGLGNIMGISGGRITVRETGVTLPVARGYSVTVDLAANDTYTVRRVYSRAGNVTIKGEYANVYCDELNERTYLASCFVNVDMPKANA
jgi:hypothetical protein